MIELLERAALRAPDSPAIITAERTTTYGRLLTMAQAAAGELAARGITRLAILDDAPDETLALLAATSSAGVEACVYPLAATDDAVIEIAGRFGHDALVTNRTALRERVGGIDPAALLDAAPPETSSSLPDARPLLILTTGTTGLPKAVRHDWQRLLRPTARITAAPEQRWLLAYGINQFGGMQMLLHVVSAGASLVVPAPIQPRTGLAMIRTHGVTHLSATPTFWRFLLAELRAGGGTIPPLRQATLSGEAVAGDLLEQVRATFPDARISQIYSATEFGPMPAVRDAVDGLPSSMLDDASADIAIRIVDGELWVRSRAAMLGYFGEEPVDPDAWRPTGDLVEVVGDRVLFRGRTSEIINVGGVKVDPLPVEQRIIRVPGVALARVFGRANRLVGAIVAAEVVPAPGVDQAELETAVRASCADLPPACRPRSIRMVAELTTTGHKIVRGTQPADTS